MENTDAIVAMLKGNPFTTKVMETLSSKVNDDFTLSLDTECVRKLLMIALKFNYLFGDYRKSIIQQNCEHVFGSSHCQTTDNARFVWYQVAGFVLDIYVEMLLKTTDIEFLE